jgi:hypothetical protein
MKIHNILSVLSFAAIALLTSCEVDNYDEPDAGLSGVVTDAVTNKPLITEQPNGYQIRYEELSWSDKPQQEHFWGKADGTFRNTKMFPGKYLITLVNGPFVQPASQEVELKSNDMATANFTVTPYVSFSDVNIAKYGSGDSVRVTFTLHKNVPNSTIDGYRIFATDQTPLVGINFSETKYSEVHYWEGGAEKVTGSNFFTLQEADLDKPITATLKGYISGKTYWIRVGARCNESPSGRVNLTEVVELKF